MATAYHNACNCGPYQIYCSQTSVEASHKTPFQDHIDFSDDGMLFKINGFILRSDEKLSECVWVCEFVYVVCVACVLSYPSDEVDFFFGVV